MTRKQKNQGMNWISKKRRLAIYMRDGLACAYCGATIEDGAILTLDHLRPWSKGGSNDSGNLVTCCKKCNSSRGDRSVRSFCRSVAGYLNHGITAKAIERHVRACARRVVPAAEAAEILARRQTWAEAIEAA